jgi:hypothetical protein
MKATFAILLLLLTASPERPHLDVHAKQWLTAFAGGEETMRAFLARSIAEEELRKRSVDERIDGYRKLRKRFGTLKAKAVLRDSPETYELLLVAADGSEHEFIFTGQADAPFKLLSIGYREIQHRH